jgi:hypothetical protein
VKRKKRLYLAGPYSQGDVARNVKIAIGIWHITHNLGFSPFCPHLSHFLHMQITLLYDDWIAYDLEWLRICDALYRIQGPSKGADLEVEEAKRLNIPVFYCLDDLIKWNDTND